MSTAYAKFSGLVAGGGGGSGTVTSVALADGSSTPIYTVSGSPVTTSGTLTETLKTQVKNTLFVGPASGADAQPTFRAVVAADVPIDTILPSQTGNNGKFLTTNGSAASWGTAGGATQTSIIVVDTPNGYGSSGTTVRTYSNVRTSTGSDITYASDATNGDTFTINTTGKYCISMMDTNTGTGATIAGPTLNCSGADLSTAVQSLAAAKRLMIANLSQGVVGYGTTLTTVPLNLTAGDVVRMQTGTGSNSANLTTDVAQFAISRVS